MKFSNYGDVEKQYNMGGNWLKLKSGENKVRLVSEFEVYGNHFDEKKGVKGLICIGKDKGCIGCAKDIEVKAQTLGWVIDRSDGKVKLFRMPYSVFKKIGELQLQEEYQFETVPNYDVTITKTGEGMETRYSVIAARKDTEITGDEMEDINKTVKPVSEIIENMKSKIKDGGAEDMPPVESYQSQE